MNTENKKEQALQYHSSGRPGKLEIQSTKPTLTSRDLSLAYSPGVAYPCMEIAANKDDVFKYTAKGNLVAVITNGSAVLGLGNIGPEAGKPVMEGKAVLFKRFADIDVFDIELNCKTEDELVDTIKMLEPTFGGINLEDIKAPECFEVEKRLQEMLNIPVFHDDQHGTAIIASAGFLNALEITNRNIADVKVVFSGAGAAAIACGLLFLNMGVKPENLIMCDSKGVIYKGRTDGMNKYKEMFANDTKLRTLEDAMKGADAFMGVSAKGIVNKEMVKSMAKNPIIFAMANPDPEITPEEVSEVRDDAIMATGRTDYPNQVNNVLGFPFIFRGALDVRARKINEEMKLAAVKAIADLAKQEVPEDVKQAYGDTDFRFGREYLIPKPFDKRVLTWVAPAVAKAAIDSGVARIEIEDFENYKANLAARLGLSASFMRSIRDRLKNKHCPKIVFPEGENSRILQAVSIIKEDSLIEPILIGKEKSIHSRMDGLNLSHLKNKVQIINPAESKHYDEFVKKFHEDRQRKGVTFTVAQDSMKLGNYFASMMVQNNLADGMITGATQNYPECIKPIMQVLGADNTDRVAGIIILVYKQRVLFLTDCTAHINPTAEHLSEIAASAAKFYRELMQKEPRVAFLSYSNFGSNKTPEVKKMQTAVKLTKEKHPEMIVDGEMQADVAVNFKILDNLFKFSTLDKEADILVFPDLQSANISYKLLGQLSDTTAIGPVLVPMKYSANIVQRTSSVEEIVNMTHLTAMSAKKVEDQNAKA